MPARLVGSVQGITLALGIAGGKIRKAVNDQIEKEALAIQEIAKAMVPIEDKDVERAIVVVKSEQRRMWTVAVDEGAQAVKHYGDGKTKIYTVGEYALWLHENDEYKLGPNSRDKRGTTGHQVGRKFLERAFAKRVRAGAIRRIAAAAKRAGVF